MMFVAKVSTLIALLSATAIVNAEDNSFDYVIVGGGTAGCVLAYRLSSDPSKTVALVEAGASVFDNPAVKTIFNPVGPSWGTAIDWNYTTVPQAFLRNRTLPYHAGKALGGTSTINGMIYLRPTCEEVDTWAAIGNPEPSVNWKWNDLLQYYKKSEQLQIPDASQSAEGAGFDPAVHGLNGNLKVGWYPLLNTSGFGHALNSTWQEEFSLSWNSDPNTGDNIGLTLFPSTRDNALNIREDSARAYYWGVADRPNLRTFVDTTALRVVIGDRAAQQGCNDTDIKVRAEGVEVKLPSGEKMILEAKREVILSAGTYRSPGLLERSGIGNPSILENLNTTTKVNLPGVGAHFQDQFLINSLYGTSVTEIAISYNLTYNTEPFEAYLTAHDLFGPDLDSVTTQLYSDITSYAKILSEASDGAISEADQEDILRLRVDLIVKELAPVGVLQLSNSVASAWGVMPLSTGNVHSSSDPSKPHINPNFLQLDWDLKVQHALSLFLRKLYQSPAVSTTLLGPEIVPSFNIVPQNATLAQWSAYYKQSLTAVWHGVGTCGMRKRKWGGVVDEEFRVYGTEGLRVVDASVVPVVSSGNPMSSIYALAEMAATLF